MQVLTLLLVLLLECLNVGARPLMSSFRIAGFNKFYIGEPKNIPDINEILVLTTPPRKTKFTGFPDFTLCDRLLTLIRNEVFTVTIPAESSCIVYVRAPEGFVLEQRSHPVVTFASCEQERFRFSSGRDTMSYCNGGVPLHVVGGEQYVGIMYQSVSPKHRQEIKFKVGLRPIHCLPGSTINPASGRSVRLWQDPVLRSAHDHLENGLEVARHNANLQVCPKTCGASKHDGYYRFVSGTLAAVGDLPYMVRVVVDYVTPENDERIIRVNCGGSILNSRHVLTAASCLMDPERLGWKVDSRFVFTADVNINLQDDFEQQINFNKFAVHPDYKPRVTDVQTKSYEAYDIAVIQLSEDIKFNKNVGTICLAPGINLTNKKATISGYGPIWRDQPTGHLWKAGVTIADYDHKCRDHDPSRNAQNYYRKACSYGLGKASCVGDAGGPLAMADGTVWYQVGVVTGGFCRPVGQPHFYANVTTFADFIRKNVRGGRCY